MARIFSRREWLAIVMAALTFTLALPAFAESSLSGTYRAEGMNPDGSTYSGAVQLIDNDGEIDMAWQIGEDSFVGSGEREGRVITVDWGDDAPVIYVIMPNGNLHGTWADGRALERLSK